MYIKDGHCEAELFKLTRLEITGMVVISTNNVTNTGNVSRLKLEILSLVSSRVL